MNRGLLGRRRLFILSVLLLTLLLHYLSTEAAEEISSDEINKIVGSGAIKPPTKEELEKDPNHIFITDKYGDKHFFNKEYWEENKLNIITEMKMKGLIK